MRSFINTSDWVLEAISELTPGVYAVDTETTGLDPFNATLLLIQVADKNGNVLIIDARKADRSSVALYLEALYNIAETLIFHNAKFDLKMLMHNYKIVPPRGKIYDTQLAEQVLYNGLMYKFPSLAELCKKYLSIEMEKDVRSEFVNYDNEFFSQEQLDYAAKDVLYLFDICSAQQYYLVKNELDYVAKIEFDLVPAVVNMELVGVVMDTNSWLEIYQENINTVNETANRLREFVKNIKASYYSEKFDKTTEYDFKDKPYNPGSWQQTLAVLHARGYKDIKSTDQAILSNINDEFCALLLEYRKAGKLSGTYGINILDQLNPITGRLHTSFHQLGTATGRFSSSDPNLQNIPRDKKYRECFIAPEGRSLITADYSQIELRLAGEFSGDKGFINAYTMDEDLHAKTAKIINRPRHDGKTLNFSILYGVSEFKVSKVFEVSKAEATKVIENWRDGYPALAQWIEDTTQFFLANGYTATAAGRRRYFDMPSSVTASWWLGDDWKTLNRMKREAVNHPIQGSSADMIKIAITNIYYRLKDYDAWPILTVHDEIVVECNEAIAEIIRQIVEDEMIKAGQIFLKKIPVGVDSKVGKVWGH